MVQSVRFILFVIIIATVSSCGMQKKHAQIAYGNKSTGTGILSDVGGARNTGASSGSLADYAQLMEVKINELNPRLYTFINDWIGIRHQLGGTTKNGVDCSGFVGILYDAVYKSTLPRTSRDMEMRVSKKSVSALKEGDLVFFSFNKQSVDHVGVYLHNNKFVHVSTRKGVIISDLTDAWYASVFVEAGSPSF